MAAAAMALITMTKKMKPVLLPLPDDFQKSMWQNFEVARKNGKFNITELGLDKDRKTKKINKTYTFFQ